MTKKYLVSDDIYSGKVVIVCETREIEVDTYKPTEDELLAHHYLYRELPEQIEKRTQYSVKVYYHYELGENNNNLLQVWTTMNKDEANELFKSAIQFCK